MNLLWELVKSFLPSLSLSYLKFIPYIVGIILISTLYISKVNLETDLAISVNTVEKLEVKTKQLEFSFSFALSEQQRLVEESVRQVERVESLLLQQREVVLNNNLLQKELDGYKGRENVLIKKPSLVEDRINDGVTLILRDITEATR